MRVFTLILALVLPQLASAETPLLRAVLGRHILPRFEVLTQRTDALNEVAQVDCKPTSPVLREAFGLAFDAWINVSHLRFGPTEVDNRAFALAFWPDPKSFTSKQLSALVRAEDPVVEDAVAFREVSIAARGFYGLEFLLYDPQLAVESDYHCQLVRAVTRDMKATTAAIYRDWVERYSAVLLSAGEVGSEVYQTEREAVQELFKTVTTGLQFTVETRLGRPLGTFDRPRPRRAEARRSSRSLRHVVLSLQSTQSMALLLAEGAPDIQAALAGTYELALIRAALLADPDFSGAGEVQGRFKLEVLQEYIHRLRDDQVSQVGEYLGVAEGFNALDGD